MILIRPSVESIPQSQIFSLDTRQYDHISLGKRPYRREALHLFFDGGFRQRNMILNLPRVALSPV